VQEDLAGSKYPIKWRHLQGRHQEGGWASPRAAWERLGLELGDGPLQTDDEVQ